MKLKEIGEFGFIKRISSQFNALLPEDILGIGDDCAVIPQGGSNLIVTTDMLVEDVHFLRSKISAFELGYKSLAVNLSDIAAMGGEPIASFISLALPADIDVDYMEEFYKGYNKLSAQHSVPLLGGDTTKSPDKLVINVAVLGKAKRPVLRSMAKPNQHICVTGPLGSSACGLHLVLNSLKGVDSLLSAHNMPVPRIQEGLLIGSAAGIGGMMDISDGMGSDMSHIIEHSGVGARIFLDKLPISEDCIATAGLYGLDPVELAVSGGEDYELLFTFDKEEFEHLAAEFKAEFGRDLYVIGETTESGKFEYMKDGLVVDRNLKGFNHF